MNELFDPVEFPHGLRCEDCDEHFIEGQPIAERLESFIDDIPLCVLTCVPCELKRATV